MPSLLADVGEDENLLVRRLLRVASLARLPATRTLAPAAAAAAAVIRDDATQCQANGLGG